MTPHEESLRLARGCETWRNIATRWIHIAVETELRLLAAKRVLEAQIAENVALRAAHERLTDRLLAAEAEIACRSGVPQS